MDGRKTVGHVQEDSLGARDVEESVGIRYGAGVAYAAFDGHRADDYAKYLYVTTDYGETWKSISTGIVMQMPRSVAAINAQPSAVSTKV